MNKIEGTDIIVLGLIAGKLETAEAACMDNSNPATARQLREMYSVLNEMLKRWVDENN